MKIKSIDIKKISLAFLGVATVFISLIAMAGQSYAASGTGTNGGASYTWTDSTEIAVTDFDGTTSSGIKNFNFVCTGNFGALTCTGGTFTGNCPPTMAIGDDTTTGVVTSHFSSGATACNGSSTPETVSISGTGPTDPNANPTPTATGNTLLQDSECTGNSTQCYCPSDGNSVNCGADPVLTECKTQADCNIVTKYVNPFIKFLAIVAGIAVTIGIIVGGIQYAASGGDPQKAASAKKHIRNAILALLAFFFLFAFLKFLSPSIG